MKFFTFKKFFQYYLPVTLTLFMTRTVERNVVTDGGYDRLYGCPLPYISGNFGCTGCYDVYILALIFDLLIYFGFTMVIFFLIQKIGSKLKTHWSLILTGVILSLFWIMLFALITQDSSFKLISDIDFETTGWRWVIDNI